MITTGTLSFLAVIGCAVSAQEDSGKDMPALIEQLGDPTIAVRSDAQDQILARWKDWSEEDLQRLAETGSSDPETRSRAQETLQRVRIRRALPESLLARRRDLENVLAVNDETDVLKILAGLKDAWKSGQVSSAEIGAVVLWIKGQRRIGKVEEFIRVLEESWLGVNPQMVVPLLRDAAPHRRKYAVDTLVRLRARMHASDLVSLLMDPDPDVRKAAAVGLVRLRASDQAAKILPLLREARVDWKVSAVDLLAGIGAHESAKEVVPSLRDKDWRIRSAAIRALVSLRAEAYAGEMVPLLCDPMFSIREEAARALGVLNGQPHANAVFGLLEDKSPQIRATAVTALAEMGILGSAAKIEGCLADRDANVRRCAARALGRLGARDRATKLLALLDDDDAWVKVAAIEALGRIGSDTETGRIARVVKNENPVIRSAAIEALGRMGGAEGAAAATDGLRDADARVRTSALWALGLLSPKSAADAAIPLLEDKAAAIREQALDTLTTVRANEHVSKIRGLLRDPEIRVRSRAVIALSVLGGDGELKEVVPLLDDSSGWVRSRAVSALGRRGSLLPKGNERDNLIRHLRRLELDPEWEVELYAGIALIRFGEKDKPSQAALVEAARSAGAEYGDGPCLELLDALAQVNEPRAFERAHREGVLQTRIDTLEALAAFVRGTGLRLDGAKDLRFAGRVLEGRRMNAADLVRWAVTPKGVVLEGDTLRVIDVGRALALWKKKVS